MENYGIDISRLTLKDNYIGVKGIVYADGLTRTNFGTYRKLLFTDKQWNEPVMEDVQNAKIVCLDPFFKKKSLLASKICHDLNKPYVSIDFNPEDELSQNATVMIISNESRKREYPGVEKEELFKKYTSVSKA